MGLLDEINKEDNSTFSPLTYEKLEKVLSEILAIECILPSTIYIGARMIKAITDEEFASMYKSMMKGDLRIQTSMAGYMVFEKRCSQLSLSLDFKIQP